MKHYHAFISYSQSTESLVAKRLEKSLQKFARPWSQLRALKVYRDTDDQNLTPNLKRSLEEAIDASEYFILLASPSSVESEWVSKELDYWLKHNTVERLLIVICDGDLVWDETSQDFDWAKTNCLPRNLSGHYDGLPLYVDLRKFRTEETLCLEDEGFHACIARLSATLRGVSLEDIVGEEVRQFRRTARIRNTAITSLSILFIAAVLLAWYAFWQRDQALEAKKNETEQKQIAQTARTTSVWQEARTRREKSPTLSIHLMADAVEGAKSMSKSSGAILGNLVSQDYEADLRHIRLVSILQHGSPVLGGFFINEQEVVTWSNGVRVKAWSGLTGESIWEYDNKSKVSGAQFDMNRNQILIWGNDGTARLLSTEHGEEINRFEHEETIIEAAINPKHSRVLTLTVDGKVTLWDSTDKRRIGQWSVAKEKNNSFDATKLSISFSNDGEKLLICCPGRVGQVRDSEDGLNPILIGLREIEGISVAEVKGALFGPTGDRVITWSDFFNRVRIWDSNSGDPLPVYVEHDNSIEGAQLTRDERKLLTWTSSGTIHFWNIENGQQEFPAIKHRWAYGQKGALLSKEEDRILTWSPIGSAIVWDSSTGEQIGDEMHHDDEVIEASFEANADLVLTWGLDDTARLWEAGTGQQLASMHQTGILGTSYRENSNLVLTWGEDGTARLWKVRESKIGPFREDVVDLATFDPQGVFALVYNKNKQADLIDTTFARPKQRLKTLGELRGGKFSLDGRRLLTWSNSGESQLWNTESGALIKTLESDHFEIPRLSHNSIFSKKSDRLLTWGKSEARLWDTENGELVKKITPEVLSGHASFTQSGGYFALWGNFFEYGAELPKSASIEIYDRNGNSAHSRMIVDGHISDVVLSRDGQTILTWQKSEDSEVRVWDAKRGIELSPPLSHQQEINGASFFPNGDVLTWSRDGNAKRWDMVTRQPILFPHKNAVFQTIPLNGERLLTRGGDRSIYLWDAVNGEQLLQFKHEKDVNGMQISLNERSVLTWSGQMSYIWDLETGLILGQPLRHENNVENAYLMSNGSVVITRTKDIAHWWRLPGDLDNPIQHSLRVKALTGTEMNRARQVRTLDAKTWAKNYQEYKDLAATHYRDCIYPCLNIFRHHFPDEAKAIRVLKESDCSLKLKGDNADSLVPSIEFVNASDTETPKPHPAEESAMDFLDGVFKDDRNRQVKEMFLETEFCSDLPLDFENGIGIWVEKVGENRNIAVMTSPEDDLLLAIRAWGFAPLYGLGFEFEGGNMINVECDETPWAHASVCEMTFDSRGITKSNRNRSLRKLQGQDAQLFRNLSNQKLKSLRVVGKEDKLEKIPVSDLVAGKIKKIFACTNAEYFD